MKLTREAGLAVNALYFCAWVITLAGLSLSQDWCRDNAALLRAQEPLSATFLSSEVGKKCSDLFRFPWFLLALSLLPLILSIGRFLRPNLVGSGSSALFAVLAALQILACDAFTNGAESTLSDSVDKVQKGNQLRAAGFGIMAAMSLLAIVVESFHAPSHHIKAEHTEPGAHTGGAVEAKV